MRRVLNSSQGYRPRVCRFTTMPKARLCHGASNTGSPFLRGYPTGPSMDGICREGSRSMSAPRAALQRESGSDHRVACHEFAELDFGQALGAGWPLGDHDVALLRARVPHVDGHVGIQLDAKVPEYFARMAHNLGAIGRCLEPH